jgi:alpha-L-fucosidase
MTSWFDTARFGMFIHWAASSQRGWELSWPLVGGSNALPGGQNIGVDEYHSTAKTFNPVKFDAREIARRARRAGMQYGVLITKHHDGYAMFHTHETGWSIEHSPYQKDIVRQYADAFRAEGLKVGFYFSLIDWHHPDYPAFTEADKPYRWGKWRRSSPEQWDRFIKVMFGQVRELLTNYGKVDLLWFDGGWERQPEEWKSSELEHMIRELQPGIIINDRLPGYGDYVTPEQAIPATAPKGPWETCMTINNSWGYNPSDRALKSPRYLLHALCEVAGKGGNLLLNISPMGDGAIPPEQAERLEVFADWMSRHQESIVGTTAGLEPWQFYGPSTRRGERVYLHLLMRPYESVSVRGAYVKRVKAVSVLGTGASLEYTSQVSAVDLMFNKDPVGELIIKVPERVLDPYATVIAIDF